MKFLVITTLLAATAVALPSGSGSSKGRDVDIQAAQQKCGTQTKASCCHGKIESGDAYEKNKGLLSGVLTGLLSGGNGGSDSLGVFDKCSDLNLLGSKCSQNVACCDNSQAKTGNGLVNVALPCLVIQDLV